MDYSLGKSEKLKSRKAISALFTEGTSVKSYPIRLIYAKAEYQEKVDLPKVAFSVPKRNFKLAVDRNRIKRLLRECYRLQKHSVQTNGVQYDFMFVYFIKEKPNYEALYKQMEKLIVKLNQQLTTNN